MEAEVLNSKLQSRRDGAITGLPAAIEYIVTVFVPELVESSTMQIEDMKDLHRRVSVLTDVFSTLRTFLDESSAPSLNQILQRLMVRFLTDGLDTRFPFSSLVLERTQELFRLHRTSSRELKHTKCRAEEGREDASKGSKLELTERQVVAFLGDAKEDFITRRYYSCGFEKEEVLRLYYTHKSPEDNEIPLL